MKELRLHVEFTDAPPRIVAPVFFQATAPQHLCLLCYYIRTAIPMHATWALDCVLSPESATCMCASRNSLSCMTSSSYSNTAHRALLALALGEIALERMLCYHVIVINLMH